MDLSIFDSVFSLPFPTQALFATLFTWSVTALGAAVVLFMRGFNKTHMDAMLGFAAGVMIAASFWSLLSPSVDMANSLGMNPWLTAALGFMAGGLLLFAGDKIFMRIEKAHGGFENSGGSLKRCLALVTSITLHNIPEGMAVGVAFGSLAHGIDGATLPAAYMLALGIGLQNFPEGTAVSVPLRREGLSKGRAFFFGQLSGIVEPVAGVIGAVLAIQLRYCLPFMLAFAAGAMIYVVITELVPESQLNRHKEAMALFTMIGFTVMTVLDVALG